MQTRRAVQLPSRTEGVEGGRRQGVAWLGVAEGDCQGGQGEGESHSAQLDGGKHGHAAMPDARAGGWGIGAAAEGRRRGGGAGVLVSMSGRAAQLAGMDRSSSSA